MPQPAEVAQAAEELIAVFRRVQVDITAQLATVATEANQVRRRARLRELQRAVSGQVATLQAETHAWLTGRLPAAYALGGQSAATVLATEFTWSGFDANAIQALAGQAWDDLLSATRYVDDATKKWVRAEARRQTELTVVEGRTAQQAGRELVKAAAGELVDDAGPVGVIRYADGSYRRLDDYADMLLRTTSARTYVAGQLNQSRQQGVTFMECFDGDDCGLENHDDDEKPDGNVYPIEVAEEFPTAHPNCVRSWSPRPDITSADEASAVPPSTTASQRADQAQAKRDRTARLTRQRKARKPRMARR
jgi:hypothetical protein